MKKPNPFCCDGCGVEKKETNHWFLAMLNVAVPFKDQYGETFSYPASVAVFDWDDALAGTNGIKHICGKNCINTLVEKNTGK